VKRWHGTVRIQYHNKQDLKKETFGKASEEMAWNCKRAHVLMPDRMMMMMMTTTNNK
jgi:hypothetical protein